ncbi:7445_t:CDS:2 [Racocetra fulgida]|uniref:mitogen-activated protein kinase kinase n=1 Tax=Racocetra fulgida TaxID=60492 RepID=A0A9N8VSX3_9GLOM|nr:7445_t:CDS:2 [Racocetra fulgida]
MATSKSNKRNVGSSPSLHRNNVPTRLDIPSTALTPSSSAPSSLSPLVVPAQASNGQMLTNEIKIAIGESGRITPQPFESDTGGFSRDDVLPSDDDSAKINAAHLQDLEKIGEGSGAFMEDDNSSISIFMEFCEGGSLDVIYKHVNQRQGTIGQKYKVSADVWSLGLTVMEVAQNRFPYPTVAPIELVAHIVNLPAPVLGDEYEWSSELRDFLKKRPTPKQMLGHPFIQKSSSREVPLRKWIKEVWEWED